MHILPEYLNYLIGFLQGDGSHYEQSGNRGKVTVELSRKDRDILEKLSDVLSNIYHTHISDRTRDTNFALEFNTSCLSIYSLEFRSFIKEYIPVGKKSRLVEPPLALGKFVPADYIRGLTDADGSLGITSLNRSFWSLCTSSDYVKEFVVSDIKDNIGIDKRINRNKRDDAYNIVLFDEDAVQYTSLLYKNASIFLDRKYAKFLEVQSWVRTIPKRKCVKKAWLHYEDEIILNDKLTLQEKCLVIDRTPKSIKSRIWRLKKQK